MLDKIEDILSRIRAELIAICIGKKTGTFRYTVTIEVNTRNGGISSKVIETTGSFREGF